MIYLRDLDLIQRKALLRSIQYDLSTGSSKLDVINKYNLTYHTSKKIFTLLSRVNKINLKPKNKQTKLSGEAKKKYELWKKLNDYEGDNCGFNFSVL